MYNLTIEKLTHSEAQSQQSAKGVFRDFVTNWFCLFRFLCLFCNLRRITWQCVARSSLLIQSEYKSAKHLTSAI